MGKLKNIYRTTKKAVGEMMKLSPWNLTVKVIRAFFDAALPFVNLYMTALILDGLVTGAAAEYLVRIVVITVVLNLVCLLMSDLMQNFNYVMWWMLFQRFFMRLSKKAISLSYEEIESAKIADKMREIQDAVYVFDNGLFKVHSQIPNFMQHFFSLCFSIYFIVSIIRVKAPFAATALQVFANSGAAVLLLVALLLVTSAVNARTNFSIISKNFNLMEVYSKISRVFIYYLDNYLDAYRAGKDIRLYRQNELISSEIVSFGREGGRLIGQTNAVTFRYTSIAILANLLLVVFAYSFVGLKSLAGAFAVGSILKYAGSILQFSAAFTGIVETVSKIISNYPYMKNYFDFVELPEEHELGSRPISRAAGQYEIRFDNVSYKYPAAPDYALKNASFTIRQGTRMAVVGENGSGKTTMIKLLCRLYHPTEGKILLGGVDINEYDYDEYLGIMGVVFQDFKLFAYPLGENVAAGETYDDGYVEKMLTQADYNEFTKLPRGLQTTLYKEFDEDGVNVSGGEALKIALARALYKNAPFLILDEPTAALDPVAESEIYASFNRISGDKTVVFISHRLSSCRFCDEILVLSKGRIVQHGAHEELVADTAGKYFTLWNSQAKHYVEEGLKQGGHP